MILRSISATIAAGAALSLSAARICHAGGPQYTIVDLGLVQPNDSASQGFGISNNGFVTGRSVGNPTQAYLWSINGGLSGLPNFAGRPFSVGNGVNNAGVVVGTGSTTLFGSDPLPLIWQNGVASQLVLPGGFTLGRANDINNINIAVGSVGSGSQEVGVMYANGGATVIDQTTSGGAFLRSAFAINDAGLVVGFGIDPNNAARNVGFVYDSNTNTAFEVGALDGANGAIAFNISNAGHIVGGSMMNQGSARPFIWTEDGGMMEIGLPVGTTSGSARGVNASGWAVGTAGGQFAVPFLFDGTDTFRLQDLIDPNSGWDLSMNTSSSAMGISDNGIIIGTGLLNGQIRAYAMVPVPAPGAFALLGLAGLSAPRRRRR